MRFAGKVTFKAVFITALLAAHLAIPAELLKALGLDTVGNVLGRHEVCIRRRE